MSGTNSHRNNATALPVTGFTLVELLVVISIVALLLALLLPTLSKARQTTRRVNCLANQQQIGLAMYMYADDNDGYYPDILPGTFAQSEPWRWAGTMLFPIPPVLTDRPLNRYLGITRLVNSPAVPGFDAVTKCPADILPRFGLPPAGSYDRQGTSYFFNAWGKGPFDLDGLKGRRIDDVVQTTRVVAAADYGIFYAFDNGNPLWWGPHDPGASASGNILFADAHAASNDFEPIDFTVRFYEGADWTMVAE